MTRLRRPVLIVLALSALSLAALIGWWPSADADEPDAEYRLGGQILTRLRDDGRIEFCFRPQGQALICPDLRLLNLERAPQDRWIESSEVRWQVPIEPDRIRYPGVVQRQSSVEGECSPDFRRMFSAIWKVETTRSFGTAFHIGGGRFITADHVVNHRPPFVSLIHGERTVPAAVIGADPEFDLALLEVHRPELVRDLPALELRAPTQDDVGDAVYLIGYPGGEALTLHGGGVVTQVWDHMIQTSSAVRTGTSGGPLVDQCGDVIGVVWAGSSSWAYTNSGSALLTSLERMNSRWPAWPRVPTDLPSPLDIAGRLIWHYGSEPPDQADCSELDAEWWIGVAGVGNEVDLRADLAHSGWRQIGVCGASGPDDHDNGRTYIAALARVTDPEPSEAASSCPSSDGARAEVVVLESREEFGAVRLVSRDDTPDCVDPVEYAIRIELDTPQSSAVEFDAALIGRSGGLVAGSWTGKSFQGATPAADSPIVSFWQEWTAPSGFEPIAVRVAIGADRWTIPLDSSFERPIGIDSATPSGPLIEHSAVILVRVEAGGERIRTCIRTAEGNQVCPVGEVPHFDPASRNRWRESSPLSWSVAVAAELTPGLAYAKPRPVDTCAYQDSAHLAGWQFNSLTGVGTAVYVGDRQFLVSRARLPDTAPWGVVARGEAALPVIAVATDPRNDLALVELLDLEDDTDLGRSVVFGSTSDRLIGADLHLVVYPEGPARRFTLAVLNVTEMTERVMRVEPSGIRRFGGPLVDLCSGAMLGLSLGGDDLLRAETVSASLAEMRTRIARPVFDRDGPPAHGSAAAHPGPLYVGKMQPAFSGKICDIHPSERYDQLYAVYVSRIDAPDIWRVYEEDGARPDTCDWGDKIFIVEYRADEAPEAICMEPRRPDYPDSTLEWEVDAPGGVELLQATELLRDDCPGLSKAEQGRWFSTHYLKLRNTGEIDFSDLRVRVENADGRRFTPRLDSSSFADSDVWGWRVRVTEGEPVKVVVTEK